MISKMLAMQFTVFLILQKYLKNNTFFSSLNEVKILNEQNMTMKYSKTEFAV